MLKRLAQLAFAKLFSFSDFRQKAVFHLRQNYFPELGFNIDVGTNLKCPIADPSAICSLAEIFFENEYKAVFEAIDLPDRWLDLGCHYGYFSLYVLSLRQSHCLSQDFKALMVDADSRVCNGVERLISDNYVGVNLLFEYGAISTGTGSISFLEQPVMSSAILGTRSDTSLKDIHSVPIIHQDLILNLISPPYDLVKIDVEGGEYDFLVSYEKILANTKALVVEWHSWHHGGGGQQQIHDLAKARGFELLKEIQPPKYCDPLHSGKSVGVLLFVKAGMDSSPFLN